MSDPAERQRLDELRKAWDYGIALARSYRDNLFHLEGEQKERQWQKFLGNSGLAAPPDPAPGLREALTEDDKLLIQRAMLYVADMRTPSSRATYSITDWNEAAECVVQLVKLATRAARPADTKKEE
jgi:hypothetical protein